MLKRQNVMVPNNLRALTNVSGQEPASDVSLEANLRGVSGLRHVEPGGVVELSGGGTELIIALVFLLVAVITDHSLEVVEIVSGGLPDAGAPRLFLVRLAAIGADIREVVDVHVEAKGRTAGLKQNADGDA